MKRLQVVAILAAVLGLSASCMKKVDTSEKVLNLAIVQKVKGMDPIYANDLYSNDEVARVYEGLLEYNYLVRPYSLKPNLAQEMPTVSKDGLTYTFKIKKGVLFHDSEAFAGGKGRELEAADFIFSIKRLADPKLQALGWWVLDGKIAGLNQWREKYSGTSVKKADYSEEIEGLKALDKYTLQIKLARPFPQFLYSLAMPFTYAVAKEVVEKYGTEFLNHPVGTGPFTLKKFDANNSKIVYGINPTFRDKKFPCEASAEYKAIADANCGKKIPFISKLVVNVMEQDQPRFLSFLKGKIDYSSIPKDNFDSVMTPSKGLSDELMKKGIELQTKPSLDVTYVAFNHDLKLFADVRLRRAMMLAYDIEESVSLFYNGNAVPAQSVVPPGIAGSDPSYVNPYRKRDLEKAKKLLAEAGFPGGKGLPVITYDAPSSTTSRQMGEFFQKKMAEIGIKISVRTSPWPEFSKKIQKRDVMLYGIAWGADYPDAENFLQLLYGPNKSPGANGSNYKNEKFDEMFKKAAFMQDSPERTELYKKLNQMAAEQVPWIFGVHRKSFVLKHKYLKNYVITDFTAGMAQFLDVDLDTKAEAVKKL